jgi:hypothetical protein
MKDLKSCTVYRVHNPGITQKSHSACGAKTLSSIYLSYLALSPGPTTSIFPPKLLSHLIQPLSKDPGLRNVAAKSFFGLCGDTLTFLLLTFLKYFFATPNFESLTPPKSLLFLLLKPP